MSNILYAKIVIEFKSALALHSGDRETGTNDKIATDWNGLPYIPATSLSGVLRSYLNQSNFDVEKWFGEKNASSLIFSNAYILNGKGLQSSALIFEDEIKEDKLLNYYYTNSQKNIKRRCHVNQRGSVAKDGGTFTISYLPAGARFVFDIHTQIGYHEYDESEIDEFKELLSTLNLSNMHLGSNTSNGMGQFKIINSSFDIIDLKDGLNHNKIRDIFNNYQLPTANVIETFKSQNSTNLNMLIFKSTLKALSTWTIGSGYERENSKKSENSKTSSFCYSEIEIKWNDENQFKNLEKVIKVCGSSIKGIIEHRVDYHYRRLTKKFAGDESIKLENSGDLNICDDVGILFGYSKDANLQQTGCIIVSDQEVYLDNDKNISNQTHNKIDYFSGGAMRLDGALFTNEVLFEPYFYVAVYINHNFFENKLKQKYKNTEEYSQVLSLLKQSLHCTFIDIQEGYLPIASKSTRGGGLTNCISSEISDYIKGGN